MSVYLKLQQARLKLSSLELKKTGENKHSKYNYYELGDFLPSITKICEELKLCSFINFNELEATLTIIDAEKPETTIVFNSPVVDSKVPGAQPIQCLGAIQTYLRRYLYMNAFEIVESDLIDETNNAKENIKNDKSIEKKNFKKEIGNMLVEMFGKENAPDELEKYTSFKSGDKDISGVKDLTKLSDKRAQVTYGKIKKDYQVWEEQKIEAEKGE